MSQVAHIANGVKAGYAASSPHTWKKLELLTDIKIPTLTPDKIDSTVSSTSPFMRSFNGMLTVSDTEITMQRDNYSATSPNQNAMFGLLASGDQIWVRIEVPADTNLQTTLWEAYEFQARVASFEPGAPVKDKQTVVVKLSFDGDSYVRYEPMASQLM